MVTPYGDYIAFRDADNLGDYAIACVGILPFFKYIKIGGKIIKVETKSGLSLIKEAENAYKAGDITKGNQLMNQAVSHGTEVETTVIRQAHSSNAGKGTTEQVTTNNLGSSAHNAANYEKLKLDLNTTESANNVVESLRNTGQLPPNYVNKTQAVQQGWAPGKALNNTVPGGQIGGDIFHNTTGVLPTSPGRIWYEADIGLSNTMSRSNQQGTRLLYSNDGLLYITTDHYKTATQIGRWK